MFNTTDQICNILTEKLKIKFSEEFPDKDLSVVVHFNPDAMSYAGDRIYIRCLRITFTQTFCETTFFR